MIYLDQNIIISFLEKNKVRFFHTVLRQNIVVSYNVLEVLNYIGSSGCEINELNNNFKNGDENYLFVDATKFSIWECMLYNPDNFDSDIDELKVQYLKFDDLLDALLKHFIVIGDKEVAYSLVKKNVFDRMKGSFHEQLGAEALFRRKSLSRWWASQKFNNDLSSIRETPYKHIQENFLNNYFKDNLKGKKVLDVGCGIGYYTIKMGKYAERTIGIDYEDSYIKIAKDKSSAIRDKVSFFAIDMTKNIRIGNISNEYFDYIFLIDIFLFLFSSEFQNELFSKKEEIIMRLAQLLTLNGKIVIMDPSLFWLTPRFGSPHHPFGIITEYKNRSFKIIPTLEEMSHLFYQCGLAISRILEPEISQAYKAIDEREYNFLTQFPQWWVFELVRYQ